IVKMKNMRIYRYIVFFIYICLVISCMEENERFPSSSDSTVPASISEIKYESLPGSIKLTYKIPEDNIISYVKAECVINGVLREVKATSYQNTLTIDGFPNTDTY